MDHLRTGVVLGQRYRLVAPVRAARPEGAWRAVDLATNRDVAVKAITAEPGSPLASPARLRLLLRTATELSYPGIAQVHDCPHLALPGDGTLPYVIRELVRGPTLEDRLSDGSLRVSEALGIVASVADALAAAHRAGIVHGNLVPANIVLSPSGVKITDFALWLVRDVPSGGEPLSVLSYVAPELTAGGPATPATDMYSLGVVFVACMSGISAGGTGGIRPEGGLAADSAASGLASLWAACLGVSPHDRPSAAQAAVVSRQMADADTSSPADVGTVQPLRAPSRPDPEWPAAPGPEQEWPAAPGPEPERSMVPEGVHRPAGRSAHRRRGKAGGRRGLLRGGHGAAQSARARRRWGGLVALGTVAVGATVAVLMVLSQFVGTSARQTASQRPGSTAPAKPGSASGPHQGRRAGHDGSSPEVKASSPEVSSSSPAAATPSSRQASPASTSVVVDRILQTITDGVNGGQIRSDAGVDFDNIIVPVRTELALGKEVPVGSLVTTLRDKLTARVREGSVKSGVAGVLRTEFTELLHSTG